MNAWVERFSVLNDPLVAKAFTEMAMRPADDHSLQSLAHGLPQSFCFRRSIYWGYRKELRCGTAGAPTAASDVPAERQRPRHRSRRSQCWICQPEQFTKAFRRTYGIEPSAVRRTDATAV